MNPFEASAQLIRESGFFDEAWYVGTYPDVAASGLDPAVHYLKFGTLLGRNPGPRFDVSFYLEGNPDVAAAGVVPLLHYLENGRREGRMPTRAGAPARQLGGRVDVIVPVHNALVHVQACLQALQRCRDGFDVQVVVVNDGSDAQTGAWLRTHAAATPNVRLLELERNQGYTRAVNHGLRNSDAAWVVVLNSDTIVTPGWLRAMLRCAATDPAIGLVGPLSNAASWQSVPTVKDASQAFAVNALPDGMSPDEMAAVVAASSPRGYPRVPILNGFCTLISRRVLEAVGLLDEAAFPEGYGEENDFCLRAGAAGFVLAVADDAYVFHAKSASFGHARRQQLSAQGGAALERKHGADAVSACVSQLRDQPGLARAREAIAAALACWGDAPGYPELFRQRVLFLLPVAGGGGGAHSVVQEAAEMHRLGVPVRVAVPDDQVAVYQAAYPETAELSGLFIPIDPQYPEPLASDCDLVVATIFSSMELARRMAAARPGLRVAYYVQDYEPLFFETDSVPWQQARASYGLVEGALLFAKTRWLVDIVAREHGLKVHKVRPSVDLDIFRPVPRDPNTGLRIVAMIRPSTPRRGPERTLRVLRALKQRHPELDVHVFGCRSDEPAYAALPTGFPHLDHGVIGRRDVAALLQRCDLLLDLSDYQAFGRSAVEAMACGCVAVVPANGGSDEFATDGVDAVVVDSLDEAACIERVSALIEAPERLRRMQARAVQTASAFTVRRAALSELAVFAAGTSGKRAVEAPVAPPPAPAPPQNIAPAVITPAPKLPVNVLVLTWDIGHNPLGRSYMLAEVLDRVARNVVIAGFQFPRYGEQVWEPVRQGRLPVIRLPGGNFPGFLDQLDQLAGRYRPDVVVACKPRLPSMQLGALMKQRFGCPLVVDIDDHELSFFKGATEIGPADLAAMADGALAADAEPYSEVWTRLAQWMRHFGDEILVSNVALEREFGGSVVPHVRDETKFDPAQHDAAASRRRYGVPPDARVVLFFGTPRAHKGINVIAEAIGKIDDPRFRLVVVGTSTDRSVTNKIESLAPGRVQFLPNQPFSAIPEIVAMADLVCLPQDENSPISAYQLPAKAIDAVAMGVPLLVTPTPPLMQLVNDGVAIEVDLARLPEQIRSLAADDAFRARWAADVRPRFLTRYSYAASAALLRGVIARAIRNVDTGRIASLPALLAEQRRLLAAPTAVAGSQAPGRDIVLFWKQNDSGLYGRRCDMVIRYLASRPDVRKVLVFDSPMSEHDLVARRNRADGLTQDREIYLRTYAKAFGAADEGKVRYDVFLYPPGIYGPGRADLTAAFADHAARAMEREGIDPAGAVFWLYPKDFHAEQIVARFSPRSVVVDVVDDHRAWPGISDEHRELLTENYRALLALADVAFANCEPVVESMRPFCAGIRLVPNGCEIDPEVVEPKDDPAYEAFRALPGKKIGFVGNLESKIDLVLIERLARSYPDAHVVLIGSTHANPQARDLAALPNVVMPGVVPYRHVGAWVREFDVAIIPHLDTDLTRAMNPLKLYVYAAHCVPVVSTEIQNVCRDAPCASFTASHEEFVAAVGTWLARPRPDRALFEGFLRENSWEARLRPHVDDVLGTAAAG